MVKPGIVKLEKKPKEVNVTWSINKNLLIAAMRLDLCYILQFLCLTPLYKKWPFFLTLFNQNNVFGL